MEIYVTLKKLQCILSFVQFIYLSLLRTHMFTTVPLFLHKTSQKQSINVQTVQTFCLEMKFVSGTVLVPFFVTNGHLLLRVLAHSTPSNKRYVSCH